MVFGLSEDYLFNFNFMRMTKIVTNNKSCDLVEPYAKINVFINYKCY